MAIGDWPLEKNTGNGELSVSSGLFAKKQAAAKNDLKEKGVKILSAGFAHGTQILILPPKKPQPKKPP